MVQKDAVGAVAEPGVEVSQPGVLRGVLSEGVNQGDGERQSEQDFAVVGFDEVAALVQVERYQGRQHWQCHDGFALGTGVALAVALEGHAQKEDPEYAGQQAVAPPVGVELAVPGQNLYAKAGCSQGQGPAPVSPHERGQGVKEEFCPQ